MKVCELIERLKRVDPLGDVKICDGTEEGADILNCGSTKFGDKYEGNFYITTTKPYSEEKYQ